MVEEEARRKVGQRVPHSAGSHLVTVTKFTNLGTPRPENRNPGIIRHSTATYADLLLDADFNSSLKADTFY